ncbi:MAG: hypothetical protein NVS1B2_17530 [Vulcanimicrobiaceae bacterium]
MRHAAYQRIAIAVTISLAVIAPFAARAAPSSFDAAMMNAMSRMNAAMTTAPMTGDADRDFISMMVPHHAGAVEMATSELEHGHDARLQRLAQEIVVTQQSEIAVMREIGRDLAKRQAKKASL